MSSDAQPESLLSTLSRQSERIADLGPRGTLGAQGCNGLVHLRVEVDRRNTKHPKAVRPRSGLGVLDSASCVAEIRHASTVVDATPTRQEVLTERANETEEAGR